MGRIDQAMSRADLDAGRGTGAVEPALSPAASPWKVEQPEDSGTGLFGAPAEVAGPAGLPVEAPAGAPAGRPAQWEGFDPQTVQRLVAARDAMPLLVEQFRSLAAALLRAQAQQPLKSIIVTSASPGDGKSHVALNLALTLSDSYKRRVLLVDADLRRPTLHLAFKTPNAKGLSEALNDRAADKVAVVRVSDTLTLLPAGRPDANPIGGLSSDRMKRLVADAAARFDWVIVDSPPVGVLADAHLVSETVDAALLVIRAGATRFPDLEAAADTLGHERILGVVLNAVDPVEIRGEGYYSHYYGSRHGTR